ncbi:MAG: hemolysin family protein [marine benthic group bacterium]|nr:hemolysin family protein [Gemmatimonadota bacterium]
MRASGFTCAAAKSGPHIRRAPDSFDTIAYGPSTPLSGMFLIIALSLVCLGACAFFSAAESALVRVRRERLAELAEQGDLGAQRAGHARQHLDRYLRGARMGIVLSVLAFGSVSVPWLTKAMDAALLSIGLPDVLAGLAAVSISLFILFEVVVLLGLALPRYYALREPERVSRVTAGPLGLFCNFVSPFMAVFDRLDGRGGKFEEAGRDRPSPDEIEALRRGTRHEGGVERDEEAMIHGVFELPNTVAREVMTPRPDIVAFSRETGLDEVLAVAAESGFSRFPVYGTSIDDVIGVVLVKDLLPWVRADEDDTSRAPPAGNDRDGRAVGSQEFNLERVIREPFFVPDTKRVDDLLAEFRAQKVHLAVVLDEFGGTDGVVTLEDLVEEIVGDIFDEHDVAEEEIARLPDGRILLDGGADLEDVVDAFDLDGVGDVEEFDTVAGYAIGRLGRIPAVGETVPIGDSELEVLETQEQRVTRLELRVRPTTSTGDAGESSNNEESQERP